jgi:oligopeptide/dipeptide ABC transporter ATP-binding protein
MPSTRKWKGCFKTDLPVILWHVGDRASSISKNSPEATCRGSSPCSIKGEISGDEIVSTLLEVKDLKTYFYTKLGVVRAVDGISFTVGTGKTIGIVGESGCGKSVTALSIMGLIRLPGKIASGEILYHHNGKIIDLLKLDPQGKQMRSIRGNEIAMIFQEPMTSMNPLFTIGTQIMESIILHQHLNKHEAREKAIDMLHKVGIPLPEQRVDEYPHQLSGGMLQRSMIAMALSCHPSLLIADEPTTALDVTIQAQVLDLIMNLRNELNTSIIIITHDLGIVAGLVDEVIVMYLGRAIEKSNVRNVFHDPKHPYTQGLMDSVPSITESQTKLKFIDGVVPHLLDIPPGCGFEPRCSKATERCRGGAPLLKEVTPDHWVACWLYQEG